MKLNTLKKLFTNREIKNLTCSLNEHGFSSKKIGDRVIEAYTPNNDKCFVAIKGNGKWIVRAADGLLIEKKGE